MSHAVHNRRIVLAARPKGEPVDGDFRLVDEVLPLPRKGQVLLRNHWLSLDPYMRGRMNAGRSYARGLEIGETLGGATVAQAGSAHPCGRTAAPRCPGCRGLPAAGECPAAPRPGLRR